MITGKNKDRHPDTQQAHHSGSYKFLDDAAKEYEEEMGTLKMLEWLADHLTYIVNREKE